MSAMLLYLVIGLPLIALLMAVGALVLTKRTHERYQEALLAERAAADHAAQVG